MPMEIPDGTGYSWTATRSFMSDFGIQLSPHLVVLAVPLRGHSAPILCPKLHVHHCPARPQWKPRAVP